LKVRYYIIGFISAVVLFSTMSYIDSSKATIDNKDSSFSEKKTVFQEVQMPPIPVEMDFSGESIPLSIPNVKERFEQEIIRNTFYHSSTIMFMKRANRFFPMIEPILKEHGIPEDFKYLAVAESSLTNAHSPAGAKGMWQFLAGTAKEYGLEVNNQVDQRYDFEKSTHAAAKYIKYLHNRFNSWTLAAAAYNMGPTGLARAKTQQKEDSYYDMNLNQETSRYVHRIASIKQIMSNPELYGFFIKDEEKYPPVDTDSLIQIAVSKSIPSIGDWAHQQGLSYRELKVINPWLRDGKLDVSNNKTYLIKVPKKTN